uniref:ABC transporter permease n=1 Tax=Roseihalotalea indica TaxID=2867963 RepID=A0AA49GQ07_9BACT|nr:ABC transporter permease [Tunicatimonas sp. TK19036]
MLTNYIKVALRNLWKRKFYTAINIAGLAIGMACYLLISVYVLDELSYDTFHDKADRIYRVTTHFNISGQEFATAGSSGEIAPALTSLMPELQQAVRILPLPDQPVKYQDKLFLESGILEVDSTFFDVFSFPLLDGNPDRALQHSSSVILTQASALKYFNRSTEVVGQTLLIQDKPYTVTGIAENPPVNSHFHFDFLIPFQYQAHLDHPSWADVEGVKTYLLLNQPENPAALQEELYSLFKQHDPEYEAIQEMGAQVNFPIQPLQDIHLQSQLIDEFEPNGNIMYVRIFVAIALFIIILACINFINLSTARSAERAKEVGIRKAIGSGRAALVGQFLAESMAISLLAMLLALGLAELLRYPFSEVAGKPLTLALLSRPYIWVAILSITLVSGLMAGLYPAWYLTRFEASKVLKSMLVSGKKSQRFRNGLVVFQFSVSICLVICTLLVYQQLQYMQNINLGFQKENVLIIQNSRRLGSRQATFLNSLRDKAYVRSVAASQQNPVRVENASDARKKGDAQEQSVMLTEQMVTHDYLETLGIALKTGRNFSPDRASDSSAVILNQAAVDALGLDEPIGALIDYVGEGYNQVIGVTEDFHYDSPHKPIAPFAFVLSAENQSLATIEVRIASEEVAATVADIKELWRQQAQDVPFVYSFLDEDYDALFRSEQRLGKLFTGFTILALIVAGLGLFGLAAYMAERRAKEIGIRKILGSSVTQVIMLLSKDFVRLLIIAFLIALPLGYLAMRQWLDNFAYRTDIPVILIILAGLSVIILAWLTVSYQSIKAALANPVDSLRNE